MEYSFKELLGAFLGSASIISVIGGVITYFLGRFDKRKAEKVLKEAELKKAEIEERDRALNRWKELYADAEAKIDKLEAEIERLKRGDSLSQPTITRLYRKVSRHGNEIDILNTIFVKELIKLDGDEKYKLLTDSISKQMDRLKQTFDDVNKSLPGNTEI